MRTLLPSSGVCHKLKLPELPSDLNNKNIDDTTKRRYTLDCRTGAATEVCRSSILVHGGLTIPLNLPIITKSEVQNELIMYFAKQKHTGASFKNLQDWISLELFTLDLITKKWQRIPTTSHEKDEVIKERLFHSMCYHRDALYVFGGLIVSPQNSYELTASNELWKLDLNTKEWFLLNECPQITKRFNHSMLIQNGLDETKDTKLLIVGGLNNMNDTLNYIDCFNIDKNEWESTKSSNRILTNIEGKMVSLTANRNTPILLEDNEAEISTLAFYVSLAQQQQLERENFDISSALASNNAAAGEESNNLGSTITSRIGSNSSTIESSPKDNNIPNLTKLSQKKEQHNSSSPIIALPLLSQSRGVRMISDQDQVFESIQNKFVYESAAYFNDNFIVVGTTSTRPSSKLYCFFYNLHFSKWTMINIDCPNSDIHTHRFWKIFTWKSHYQALLLGTQHDDFNIASVQKFDCLLSFGLPMTNLLNKAAIIPNYQFPKKQASSADYNTPKNIENSVFRQRNSTANSTSQFESYIKYITAPVNIESTSSVFPPHAMVLGKDSFDIYGDLLSDFEFITSEGESVAISIYVLRKRWGRYFDFLLSKCYSKACGVYESAANPSTLMKQPTNLNHSETSNLNVKSKGTQTSRSSLDGVFDDKTNDIDPMETTNSQNSGPKNPIISISADNDKLSSPNSLLNLSIMGTSVDGSSSNPVHSNRYEEFKTLKKFTTPTTSSSSGMVFRVPFQDKVSKEVENSNNKDIFNDRRRSSLVVAYDQKSTTIPLSHLRRASHPAQWPPIFRDSNSSSPKPNLPTENISNNNVTNFRRPSWRLMSSVHNSRQASIASQNSSISFVSSTSDRMGNSISIKRSASVSSSNHSSRSVSPIPPILNISLPPISNLPDDPIPPQPPTKVPLVSTQGDHRRKSTTSRNTYFIDVFDSNRTSPFSSRRTSKEDRQSSFAESIGSYNSPKHSCDEGKFFSSPTRQRRQSSYTSNEDSLDSLGHDAGYEVEPLLMPRSLYMPWPTETVTAFAEFLYTGQINKKWLLAPVVLDLLVMSKIYDVPLLYEMICDILYSIIGKKEENLHYDCNNMDRGFTQLINNCFNDDTEKVKEYLDENEAYNDLTKLKKSLNDIDDGFLVVNLLSSFARNFSNSTNYESENNDLEIKNVGMKPTKLSLSTVSLTKTIKSGFNIADVNDMKSRCRSNVSSFANNDVGSISSNLSPRKISNNPDRLPNRKKSILHKEVSKDGNDEHDLSNITNGNDIYEDDLEQVTLQELSEADYSFHKDENIDPKSVQDLFMVNDDDYQPIMNKTFSIGTIKQANKSNRTVESNSSESDCDELDSQFDGFSRFKMTKQLREDIELDESIDPLYRFSESDHEHLRGSFSNSDCLRNSVYGNIVRGSKNSKLSLRNDRISIGDITSKDNNNKKGNSSSIENSILRSVSGAPSIQNVNRRNTDAVTYHEPTLENIISPDALPPVDCILKSIYRATVLVNDSRIMSRCMECIELSKRLKIVKKKILNEVQYIGDQCKKSKGTKMSNSSSIGSYTIPGMSPNISSNGNNNRSSVSEVPGRAESIITSRTLPRIRSRTSVPNFKLKHITNGSIDPLRRKSSKLQSISPRTSLSVNTSNNTTVSGGSSNKLTNSYSFTSISNSSSKLSMYPPLIPNLSNAPSPKTKRELNGFANISNSQNTTNSSTNVSNATNHSNVTSADTSNSTSSFLFFSKKHNKSK